MNCGVGCRRGSELALLWLWLWPAAVAPIRLLAREPPYVEGAALKKKNKTKNNPPPRKTPISPAVAVVIMEVGCFSDP